MSGTGDERLERGYRAANDALDERPSAVTRAAILAAAARQVQAGPRDARAPRGAPRSSAMSRWPMAAAAAVLLSTLAVMMAVRTEQEMPSFSEPAERAEPRVATATDAPAAAGSTARQDAPAGSDVRGPDSPSTAASAEPGAPAVERKRATARESAVAAPPAAAPPRTLPDSAASSAPVARDQAAVSAQADAKVAAAVEGARVKEEAAAQFSPATPSAPSPAREASRSNESVPAAAPPAPPLPRAKVDAAPTTDAESRRSGRADGTGAALSKLRQEPAPTGALSAGIATSRSEVDARTDGPLRADEWLDKIIKLRKGGRHDEADAELKRFREHYPHVQVPADALPATGTR